MLNIIDCIDIYNGSREKKGPKDCMFDTEVLKNKLLEWKYKILTREAVIYIDNEVHKDNIEYFMIKEEQRRINEIIMPSLKKDNDDKIIVRLNHFIDGYSKNKVYKILIYHKDLEPIRYTLKIYGNGYYYYYYIGNHYDFMVSPQEYISSGDVKILKETLKGMKIRW